MAPKSSENELHLDTFEFQTQQCDVCLLGTTPLIMHRMSEKARQELLLPAPKKNAAEKALILKHQPYDEYRASAYRFRQDGPTRLLFPGNGFKMAIASAALRMPGATKTEIGQLVQVPTVNVAVWGQPQIFSTFVRLANQNKTPDVRTRAVLPAWACKLSVRFPHPLLREPAVMKLLAGAGLFVGIGDWRPEKKGTYGTFEFCDPDDERFLAVLEEGGREAQDHALAHPAPYDLDTEELLAWYDQEVLRRDRPDAEPARNGRARRQKKEEVPS